jgi:hypothetical protein
MKIVVGIKDGVIKAASVLGIETLQDVKDMESEGLDIKVIEAASVTIGQQYPVPELIPIFNKDIQESKEE